MNGLGFVVIGAQKAGTTTIFAGLRQHPDVFVPASKEAPIFDRELDTSEYESYLRTYFSRARPDQVTGTVSPQYLVNESAIYNITRLLPTARLVVVLRDPVERALSHFIMDARRGKAPEDLSAALRRELRSDEEGRARSRYVGGGLYGFWLSRWQKAGVQADQLLTLRTVDLASAPEAVGNAICDHLRVERRPMAALSRVHHRGGVQRRFPFLDRARRTRAVRAVRKSLPESVGSAIGYRLEQLNVVPSRDRPQIAMDVLHDLNETFDADRQLLLRLGFRSW